jgi:hypothetical protein
LIIARASACACSSLDDRWPEHALLSFGTLDELRQRYRHVQAITVAIDQYAEKALGNRDYFLNKPYGVGQGRLTTALRPG